MLPDVILSPKCTTFDFGWGRASDAAGRAHWGFTVLLLREEEGKRKGRIFRPPLLWWSLSETVCSGADYAAVSCCCWSYCRAACAISAVLSAGGTAYSAAAAAEHPTSNWLTVYRFNVYAPGWPIGVAPKINRNVGSPNELSAGYWRRKDTAAWSP